MIEYWPNNHYPNRHYRCAARAAEKLFRERMKPYVYYVQFIDGDFYIGCRTGKGCSPDELMTEYTTSSNIVNDRLSQGDKIALTLAWEYNDPNTALLVERRMIQNCYSMGNCLNINGYQLPESFKRKNDL